MSGPARSAPSDKSPTGNGMSVRPRLPEVAAQPSQALAARLYFSCVILIAPLKDVIGLLSVMRPAGILCFTLTLPLVEVTV